MDFICIFYFINLKLRIKILNFLLIKVKKVKINKKFKC
jgi:hypothetical protein